VSNIEFKLISVFFKLKSTVKQELGKDMSRQVVDKTKYYYKELDKSKPKENGVMRIHRTMWVLGLALYRAMQDELGNRDDLVDIVLKVMWLSALCDSIRMQAFFVRRSKDPFNLFLRLLGPRNERFFTCPPWEKVEVALENGVVGINYNVQSMSSLLTFFVASLASSLRSERHSLNKHYKLKCEKNNKGVINV
jgi:hypothetical protein